jgi:hypothetical protein
MLQLECPPEPFRIAHNCHLSPILGSFSIVHFYHLSCVLGSFNIVCNYHLSPVLGSFSITHFCLVVSLVS